MSGGAAAVDRAWLLRFLRLVAGGIVLAVAVTEGVLALGFDLLDAPFFQAPGEALGLGAAALAFAAFQTRPAGRPASRAAALLLFGVVVLPFNAFGDKPAMPVEFWKGTAGLLLDRSMTVGRPHAVVLLIKGAQPVGKGGAPAVLVDASGTESIVGRLFGDPADGFTVRPEGDQARSVSLTDDMRWAWSVTPRREGPQRLVLELDTLARARDSKDRDSKNRASNIYRQLVVVRVLPPSWYEKGRNWLLGRS